jgi:hypothetical protein
VSRSKIVKDIYPVLRAAGFTKLPPADRILDARVVAAAYGSRSGGG